MDQKLMKEDRRRTRTEENSEITPPRGELIERRIV